MNGGGFRLATGYFVNLSGGNVEIFVAEIDVDGIAHEGLLRSVHPRPLNVVVWARRLNGVLVGAVGTENAWPRDIGRGGRGVLDLRPHKSLFVINTSFYFAAIHVILIKNGIAMRATMADAAKRQKHPKYCCEFGTMPICAK